MSDDGPPDPPAGPVDPGLPAAAPRASRAGRDLPMAIGVGVGLGILIVGSLLLYRPAFVVIIAAAVLASVWEMSGTLRRARSVEISWLPVGLGAVAIVAMSWFWGHEAQALGLALAALVCLLWRFPRGAEGYLRDVSASIFLLVYLGLFASFATLLVRPEDGAQRAMVFLIVVVCSDTGGYAAGALLGRHPMAPTISPKKSWEGFAGSAVAAMIGGALSVSLMLHTDWWEGVVVGAVLTVVAVIGDLAESLIKRDLGVKDMGTLLPGHGGVMDRLDSLLPSAVVAWALLAAFV
ncbi:phosphatidate cytidylyltransferase [Nakamurella sp. A5-74]|uniref:Phosphatidate cytidylyltransferase n=1 Tax=Nakamurella sp. A5-74 TaxID=3158264 RepID=A0AAU8DJH4_9ACTN